MKMPLLLFFSCATTEQNMQQLQQRPFPKENEGWPGVGWLKGTVNRHCLLHGAVATTDDTAGIQSGAPLADQSPPFPHHIEVLRWRQGFERVKYSTLRPVMAAGACVCVHLPPLNAEAHNGRRCVCVSIYLPSMLRPVMAAGVCVCVHLPKPGP